MIVTVDQMKDQLNVLSSDDDEIIERKIAAAQSHIERLLGFKIEETYGGTDQEEIPPALVEAVCQLAAHWFVWSLADRQRVSGVFLWLTMAELVASNSG
jgi:hypothetical protein